jgi:hypothetical protein
MKELKKIDQSLQKLQQDFNTQLEALGSDTKEFHNALIELSAKYPDHKELLQFIVFINDKLEINQNIFHEIVCDSLNQLIALKKDLVCDIMEIHGNTPKEEKTLWGKVKGFVGSFKNAKIILTALAVISLAAAVIIAPAMFLKIIAALAALL